MYLFRSRRSRIIIARLYRTFKIRQPLRSNLMLSALALNGQIRIMMQAYRQRTNVNQHVLKFFRSSVVGLTFDTSRLGPNEQGAIVEFLPRPSHRFRAASRASTASVTITFTLVSALDIRNLYNMPDKPKIPSWQRALADGPITSPSKSKRQSESNAQSEDTASPIVHAPTPTEGDVEQPDIPNLLDQASRFLEDATIRDAPREKKVAFLESKGVKAENIETLLGADAQDGNQIELEETGERAWSSPVCYLQTAWWCHVTQPMAMRLIFLGGPEASRSVAASTATTRYSSHRHLS